MFMGQELIFLCQIEIEMYKQNKYIVYMGLKTILIIEIYRVW